MSKSLIIMPRWVGDFLLALAAVERKAREGSERMTLLVPSHLTMLARTVAFLPMITRRRKTRRERHETLRQINRENADNVYVLPHSFSSALFAARTRIRKRRGIRGELRTPLLTDPLSRELAVRSRHLLHEYCDVLQTAHFDPLSWKGITVTKKFRFLDSIVFCPGARYGPAKCWPLFSELAVLLRHDRIVILGDTQDRATGEKILQAAPDRVTNLAGETTLPDAAAIMAAAKCVVSNDSGLMHLAGYIGAPVVGLFGSTSPTWTRPLGSATSVVYRREKCSPCFKRTCRYNHYRCLYGIEPPLVADRIRRLTENRPCVSLF